MRSNYTVDVLHSLDSFTGGYLRNWCIFNMKYKTIFFQTAWFLYDNYFGDKSFRIRPNSKVYYWICGNEGSDLFLRRNIDKSPRPKNIVR
jgi:hypothetical protein